MSNEVGGVSGSREQLESMDNDELVESMMTGLRAEAVVESRMKDKIIGSFKQIFGDEVSCNVSRIADYPGKIYDDSSERPWGGMRFSVEIDSASASSISDRFADELSRVDFSHPMVKLMNFICDKMNERYPELCVGVGTDDLRFFISIDKFARSAVGGAPESAGAIGELEARVGAVLDGGGTP